ncbi:MAG: hypothetical protein EB015_16615 [Methylocystaceae bacterium]|nr:hypothetical protein [Methylocystaceae bacterium]
MNFARDLLPLLLAGGGMAAAAKSGLFDGKEAQANNDVWKNLSAGKNADGSANTNSGFPGAVGAPTQLPGAKLAGNPLAGNVAQMAARAFPFQAPNQAFNLPTNAAGGPMMAQLPGLLPAQPQGAPVAQPQMTAGLLGTPDERSQADFLKSQLYGSQPQKPVATAGGSATPQSNPFLYASLYNNNRQVQ